MRALRILTVAVLLAAPLAAQEAQEHHQAPAEGQAAVDMEAAMAEWMKYAAPGDMHQHLAKLAGDWSAELQMWMQPGAEPTTMQATAHAETILGGRFVEMHHQGEMMGQPFHGIGIDGYNNLEKRFESSWVDNMGTLIMFFTGNCDTEDCSVRTMTSELMDPTMGRVTMKMVTTWMDDDHFKLESFMVIAGEETKNMEILFTRQ